MKDGDIDKANAFDCKTVNGSRKMHQVRFVCAYDTTLIEYMALSCSCFGCDGRGVGYLYEQAGYIKSFELYKLNPCNISEVKRSLQTHEGDVHFSSGREAMCDDLVVGDNAAILCESHDTNKEF